MAGEDGIIPGTVADGVISAAERQYAASLSGATGATGTPEVITGTGTKVQIPWTTSPSGKIVKTKGKTEAYNYLTPKSPEYDLITQNWKSLGNSDLKSKTLSSFWKKVVDKAAANNVSPWDIMNTYIAASKDGTLPPYAGGSGSGSGGSSKSTNISIQQYDRTTSDVLIDSILSKQYGRTASASEKETFFSELNKAAKAGSVTTTTRKNKKTVTTTTNRFDQKTFTDKYSGTVLDKMLNGTETLDLSGEAGKIQDTLRKYSDDMGIVRSDKDILSDVRRVVKGEITADDAANEVRKQSAVLYKNYADRLNSDPTLTVRDLANPYIKLMADTFETDMNNISLNNPTIQTLLSADKPPSYGEFYKQLRGMTEFRNTTTAQKEASSFASGLASAMGF
jgi:hypothetical protein